MKQASQSENLPHACMHFASPCTSPPSPQASQTLTQHELPHKVAQPGVISDDAVRARKQLLGQDERVVAPCCPAGDVLKALRKRHRQRLHGGMHAWGNERAACVVMPLPCKVLRHATEAAWWSGVWILIGGRLAWVHECMGASCMQTKFCMDAHTIGGLYRRIRGKDKRNVHS